MERSRPSRANAGRQGNKGSRDHKGRAGQGEARSLVGKTKWGPDLWTVILSNPKGGKSLVYEGDYGKHLKVMWNPS